MEPNPPERRELLKSALVRIEQLEKRLAAAEQRAREPLAVLGIGCRFPGGANNPDAFWTLLREGVDAIVDIPASRWDPDEFYDPDPDAPGKMYARGGGFVDDVDLFDPTFFGIAPREAPQMDPQQRLLLETAWSALEHAGIAPGGLTGSATGVFIGMTTHDYARMQASSGGLEFIDTYFGTGVAGSVAAGRLSYVLGLRGPAVTVDTACSSSLVALHLACQSLRNGETRLALAGGVNLILWPEGHVIASKGRMLAPDSRCKTFDASADGYVRSEGCGLVVLKRLSDALADGDPVLAVIRGTSLNQDGRSSGMTAPNGRAQEDVMRQALADAGVAPSDVAYVETHGTGTSLGDPIEVQALGAVQGTGRAADNPLLIGSVKTNIGHLEAAAGVAGVIKAVLSLHYGEIPPHLHFQKPNPLIPWDAFPVKVAASRQPWPKDRPRVIGVSSFGFSGTNAHIVLDAAPAVERPPLPAARSARVLILSGRTPAALQDAAALWAPIVEQSTADRLADICYTASVGRSHFEQRLAIVGDSPAAIAGGLRAYVESRNVDGLVSGEASLKRHPEMAFLFTGQGAQYANMGRGLYETAPVFRAVIDKCDALLGARLGRSLVSVLYPPPGQEAEADALLARTEWTQPALFAIEYALAELWKSWGIVPSAVMGHSVGEFVAACVAGVFSLEDGLALVAERGRLMQALPEGGSMVALPLPEAQVAAAIKALGDRVSIAAINAPTQTVVSGPADAVAALVDALGGAALKAQRLSVSHAFHSSLVEPMLDEFERFARRLTYRAPQVPVISNVTGTAIDAPQTLDAAYWRRHARAAVRFSDSLVTARQLGCRVILEVGPNPTLIGLAARGPQHEDTTWVPSLRKAQDDWRRLALSLGTLFVAGVTIDWHAWSGGVARKIQLPTYPFQRERFWIAPPVARTQAQRASVHPLLGSRLSSPRLSDVVFERELDAKAIDWLSDHRIFDRVVVPAAAYLEAALAASRVVLGPDARVGGLRIHEPLVLDTAGRTLQTIVIRSATDVQVQIHSRPRGGDGAAEEWTLHADGHLLEGRSTAADVGRAAASVDARDTLDPAEYYARLSAGGADYGPAFRGLSEIARGEHVASGTITVPSGVAAQIGQYHLHPALLDVCFQLLGVALPGADGGDDVFLPMEAGEYRLTGIPQGRMQCVARVEPSGSRETFVGEVALVGADNVPVAEISGLRFKRASRAALARASRTDTQGWLHELRWREIPAERETAADGSWVIFGDHGGFTDALAGQLTGRGASAIVVHHGDAYSAPSGRRATIRPDVPGDFTRLLAELDDEPIRGICHAWALDVDSTAPIGKARLLGPVSLLHLAQAMLSRPAGPALTIVTRGAQVTRPADAATVAIGQAPVWGVARVLSSEQPALRTRAVDLDPVGNVQNDATAVTGELLSADREESQVALRGGRFGARLARAAAATKDREDFHIKSDAWYAITGGTGAIGLEVARWLVTAGAKHVALLGRRASDAQQSAAVSELEQLGAEVVAVSVDVADFDALEGVLARLESSHPLAGVLHAAGMIDDGLVPDMDADRMARVMRPKVEGGWNIHRATEHRSLDFVALFSAGAALFGAPGQANYAAANTFLDALAWYREARGLRTMSVNWGPWAGAGMAGAVGRQNRERWSAQGIGLIEPAKGTAMLEAALRADRIHVAVLPIDWARFIESWAEGAEPALLRDIAHASRTRTRDGAAASRGKLDAGRFLEQLKASPPDRRPELLRGHVREQALGVLGLSSEGAVRDDSAFSDLGMDSLMAVELSNRLRQSLKASIPSTIAFEHPTVAALTDYLVRGIAATLGAEPAAPLAPAAVAVAAADPTKLLARIGELTDADVDAMLGAMLAEEQGGE